MIPIKNKPGWFIHNNGINITDQDGKPLLDLRNEYEVQDIKYEAEKVIVHLVKDIDEKYGVALPVGTKLVLSVSGTTDQKIGLDDKRFEGIYDYTGHSLNLCLGDYCTFIQDKDITIEVEISWHADKVGTLEYEAPKAVQQLIEGEKSPREVALWAESFEYPQHVYNISQPLRELIDDLSLAAAINETGEFLYGPADFGMWLDEYIQGAFNDKVEKYASRVFSSYGLEEGSEEELYDLIFLRQEIHEVFEASSLRSVKLDVDRLREIDSQWQGDIDDRHDSVQLDLKREKITKQMWWYWVDQLQSLSEPDLKTL